MYSNSNLYNNNNNNHICIVHTRYSWNPRIDNNILNKDHHHHNNNNDDIKYSAKIHSLNKNVFVINSMIRLPFPGGFLY